MIKIRRTWDINPVERVVPNKKKKRKHNKKSEERYLITDALEVLDEEKQKTIKEETSIDTSGAS